MKIDKLIELNDEQLVLVQEMQALYLKMQKAKMAFVVNENGAVAVYNSEHIDDCTDDSPQGNPPEGYECADMNQMTEVFQVWASEELYVKPKE